VGEKNVVCLFEHLDQKITIHEYAELARGASAGWYMMVLASAVSS
jgi:hypothetical protein